MTPGDAKRAGTLRLPPGTIAPAAKVYGLLVEGNDLAPRFCQGDTVIANPAVPPKPGDHVVYWLAEPQGRPLLRKLESSGTGAEKAETGATLHKVVAVYRPE